MMMEVTCRNHPRTPTYLHPLETSTLQSLTQNWAAVTDAGDNKNQPSSMI